MITLTDFTSYSEVRTTCGLSIDELPDSVISEEIYTNSLELALGDVELPDEEPGPGPLAERFITISLIDPASRTTLQQKLYNLTRVFATYAVAYEVVVSLSMRAPKTISDSKASIVRFSPESVYENVIARIKDKLDDLRQQIENITTTTLSPMPYLTAIKRAVDPVTGG